MKIEKKKNNPCGAKTGFRVFCGVEQDVIHNLVSILVTHQNILNGCFLWHLLDYEIVQNSFKLV